MRSYITKMGLVIALSGLLAACGRGGLASPTAIPADVVRPVQPTPAYPKSSAFTLALTPTLVALVTPLPTTAFAPIDEGQPLTATLLAGLTFEQTPSAMGIARGGAILYKQPGGASLATLPAGTTVTVTGKSTDGKWLAAYTDAGLTGWIEANRLLLYGADDLLVVAESAGPGPIATLIAQAMQPIPGITATLEAAVQQAIANSALPTTSATTLSTNGAPTTTVLSVAALPVVVTPTATPAPTATPEPTATAQPTLAVLPPGALRGTVTGETRLNVRAAPETTAEIIAKLPPGEQVVLIGRNAAGDWLQIQLPDGRTGWVAASFIAVTGQ